MKWAAMTNFAQDPAAMRLLLSGAMQALFVAIVLVVIARAISQPVYHRAGNVTSAIWRTFTGRTLTLHMALKVDDDESNPEMIMVSHSQSDEEDLGRSSSSECDYREDASLFAKGPQPRKFPGWSTIIMVLTPIITTCILQIVRPTTFPYAHMSGTLPYTLREIWSPSGQAMCQAGFRGENAFPYPDLVSTTLWEPSNGTFVGWMPHVNGSLPSRKDAELTDIPSWLPKEPLPFPGFERWYRPKDSQNHHDPQNPNPSHEGPHSPSSLRRPPTPDRRLYGSVRYDPAKDPLRITNLDQEILKPIADLLATSSVKIRHVIVMSLESTRKDMFPFKKGSHIHDIIRNSHRSEDIKAGVDTELSKLSINAELLTGETSGFVEKIKTSSSTSSKSWRNLSKDRGGINVIGALTPSTTSFKSFLGSTCGVQALPVDFTVEAHGYIYQPCLPSIFELFNKNKTADSQLGNNGGAKSPAGAKQEDITAMPWRTIQAQSITDHYDYQDELEERMGFQEVITKSTLLDPESKHFPPKSPEVNYFGFTEQEIKPYLKDAFLEAKEKNQRLFMTHFTSTTHHPWAMPETSGNNFDFLSRWGKESSLNKFLNTVRYVDGWLGEVMDLLEEVGAAEETLVVMVGDHGMTFKEESSQHSTFENGRISNLRVPLIFHHPLLPRIQLNINATSLSIIPTILDLLTSTASLNPSDSITANHLMNQYEGQSLIRPFQATKNGRHQWNIGVLSAGGAILSVSSAAVPHRLVLPVCKAGTYRFTSNLIDPDELDPIEDYSIVALARRVRNDKRFGDAAADWVLQAERMGKWWVKEQRRKWGYRGASLMTDRTTSELKGVNTTPKKHWWET